MAIVSSPETTRKIALASVPHDPEARHAVTTAGVTPLIQSLFGSMHLVHTSVTHPDTLGAISAIGENGSTQVNLHDAGKQEGNLAAFNKRDAVRRAVAAAHENGTSHILQIDFDRLLWWAAHEPDELRDILQRGAEDPREYLILGRTPEAMATHPRVQREAEVRTMIHFTERMGDAFDLQASRTRGTRLTGVTDERTGNEYEGGVVDTIAGAAFLASVRPADEVAVHAESRELWGNDTEWPSRAVAISSVTAEHELTRGLAFEEVFFSQREIARLGGMEPWLDARYSDNTAEYRGNVARDAMRWTDRVARAAGIR